MLGRREAAHLDGCDRDELHNLAPAATASQQVRSWLDAFDGRLANAAAHLAAKGRCEPPAEMVGGGRRSKKDAEAAVRRGDACELLPALGQALAAGEVTAGHADALADLAGKLGGQQRARLHELEDEVVGSARTSTVEDFQRQMIRLRQRLDGDEGASRREDLRRRRCLRQWRDRTDELDKFLLAVEPETAPMPSSGCCSAPVRLAPVARRSACSSTSRP